MASSSPHPQPPDLSESRWQAKTRVEALYPDFPDINVSAPDFDLLSYGMTVQEMLRDAGVPMRPFSITWHNLTCSVPVQPPQKAIATVVSGFSSLFHSLVNGFASALPSHHKDQPPPPAHVLNAISGYLKPRQLCLVLGTSGSGTSLFLKRLAGRNLPRLISTEGDVLYQGETRLAGLANPTHIVHYIPQEDHHIAELTVRHTFEFAANCQWPAWAPHVEALRKNDVILTARLLGIERTLDTIVGSDILRGVSGGERKRVTIGEMGIAMVSGTLVMDNWSKGLDSATTLSITTSMRKFVDALGTSAIVSMQAPGTEVFNLFDTVCLLHEGEQIFFGPRKSLEPYLNSLGFNRPRHRSLPDFVSTVADPELRNDYLCTNPSGPAPPSTGAEFAERFRESECHTQVIDEILEINREPQYEARIPKNLEKIAKNSTAQSPRFQIRAMARRQMHWLSSVRRNVLTDMMQNLVFGLIIGSIFWQLSEDAAGASSRVGVIFLALLFIGLAAVGKIRDRFQEKVVFTKQRNAGFFAAWTYLLTQAVFDFAIELIKTACMFIPLYLMAGLNLGSSAQRLLFAILIATCASLFMLSLTRFFVALFDEPSAAQGIAGLFTILMVLFCGYMKSGSDLDGYLVWLYWANPFHYALEALLINEFDGLNFTCTPSQLLPPKLLDPDGLIPDEFRICTVSTGLEYLKNFRGIDLDKIFRLYYFLAVVAFVVLFFIFSAFSTANALPLGHALQARVRDPRPSEGPNVSVNLLSGEDSKEKTSFTFTNLKYSVLNGAKTLLTDVTGNTVGGKVVLLMGESGAGKTTLLDVCAMRKTLKGGATVSGDIRLNGVTVNNEELAFSSGYCEQNDMHVGEATVFEAVFFSANLRLPGSMSADEKRQRTHNTISLLGLEAYSAVLVKALGSGELKLLTMALEVVTDPKVLFLDEPTSGISSSSALTVGKALRKIADSGTAVICTVHQPSSEVFTMFDRLLLLKRGGKTVYFGDIGERAAALRKYFEAHGATAMDEEENPAAWMLDVIADGNVDWVKKWNESEERKTEDARTHELASEKKASGDGEDSDSRKKFDRPPIPRQVWQVVRRQFWRYWRLPEYNVTRVFLNLMIALLVGLLFLREIDDTQAGANLAFASLFLSIIPAALAAQNVIPTTMSGRAVFYREVASGTYRAIANHVAVGVVEVPFTVVTTTVFSLVFYFMVGLDSGRFLYFFLAVQLLYVMAVMFGIMLASISPTLVTGQNMENSIFSIFQVLSGFFIIKPELPVWWRWTVWINPFSYYLSGILQNHMSDRVFTCVDEELAFRLPPNATSCEALSDLNLYTSTGNGSVCAFCAIPSGNYLIDLYGADDVNKWVSLLALLVVILVFRVIAGIGFAKFRFLNR